MWEPGHTDESCSVLQSCQLLFILVICYSYGVKTWAHGWIVHQCTVAVILLQGAVWSYNVKTWAHWWILHLGAVAFILLQGAVWSYNVKTWAHWWILHQCTVAFILLQGAVWSYNVKSWAHWWILHLGAVAVVLLQGDVSHAQRTVPVAVGEHWTCLWPHLLSAAQHPWWPWWQLRLQLDHWPLPHLRQRVST